MPTFSFKKKTKKHQWLMPVILATQQAEIKGLKASLNK
jgi:hypothetical protein